MKTFILCFSVAIIVAGWARFCREARQAEFIEKRLLNVTQLTSDGGNGEAYFIPDGEKPAFASNRNPQKPRAMDIFIAADWIE